MMGENDIYDVLSPNYVKNQPFAFSEKQNVVAF